MPHFRWHSARVYRHILDQALSQLGKQLFAHGRAVFRSGSLERVCLPVDVRVGRSRSLR